MTEYMYSRGSPRGNHDGILADRRRPPPPAACTPRTAVYMQYGILQYVYMQYGILQYVYMYAVSYGILYMYIRMIQYELLLS